MIADFGRHDGLDVVPRHELDVVHGEDVGRIRHRDRQRGARAAERNDLHTYAVPSPAGNELDDRWDQDVKPCERLIGKGRRSAC